MNSTVTVADVTASAPTSPDLNHYFCCDPDLSLCGVDLDGIGYGWESHMGNCVVCEGMVDAPCSPTCHT